MSSVIVVGAGGFGREVLDVLRDQKTDIRGVVDDSPSSDNLRLLEQQDVEYLGKTSELTERFATNEVEYLIGIGDGRIRRAIDEMHSALGFTSATAVHSSATFGHAVEIGPGSVICAGVRATTNIRIGRHVHLNLNVTVGHDVLVGSYASANPGAAISGAVSIGDSALIGANSFILQGVEVGADSIVGASAAVVKRVDPGTTVAGVPARLLSRRS